MMKIVVFQPNGFFRRLLAVLMKNKRGKKE